MIEMIGFLTKCLVLYKQILSPKYNLPVFAIITNHIFSNHKNKSVSS